MLEMAEKGSFVSRASGLGLVKCDLIYLWWLPTGFGANLIILLYDGGVGGVSQDSYQHKATNPGF